MSDLRSLEHSTLKVPYEILNKKFRTAQKTIDREISHVQHTTNAVEKALQKETVHAADVNCVVKGLLDKLNTLKQKASNSMADETEATAIIKKRLEHLKVSINPNIPRSAVEQWKEFRVERLLVDYLLRAGYYETSCQLAEHNGIEYMSNLGVFHAAKQVEESLYGHETVRCLDWCHDNKSKLRRLHSRLELMVRQQEFVEFVRAGRKIDAVQYARKYFSNVDGQIWNQELKSTMGILAFGNDPQPYHHLFSEQRWHDIIQTFRQENFRLYQLAHQSVFSACLQSGLSALKTPHCSGDGIQCTGAAKDCPVCIPDVNALASNLPYAHASQSRLVCAITGQPLNEHNPPMMLPNGMVYGQNALDTIAAENDGSIVCPRSGTVCSIDQVVRVYIM